MGESMKFQINQSYRRFPYILGYPITGVHFYCKQQFSFSDILCKFLSPCINLLENVHLYHETTCSDGQNASGKHDIATTKSPIVEVKVGLYLPHTLSTLMVMLIV